MTKKKSKSEAFEEAYKHSYPGQSWELTKWFFDKGWEARRRYDDK